MRIRVERRQHELVAQLLEARLMQDVRHDRVNSCLKHKLIRAVAEETINKCSGRAKSGSCLMMAAQPSVLLRDRVLLVNDL